MKLISGQSHPYLAQSIADALGLCLVRRSITRFQDSEVHVQIHESVRGQDMFIIQPTCDPVNETLMELLVIIDALKRASAHKVTAVIPYFGYARQDRKSGERTAITAKLVANLITHAGADQVITVDSHTEQFQGFFDIPVDNLGTHDVKADKIKDLSPLSPPLLVAPDTGGIRRSRDIANILNLNMAVIDKHRPAPGKAQVLAVMGNVQQKHCILIDDILDSGETLCQASEALRAAGAGSVQALITHGVLSGDAQSKIESSFLDKVVITDSIPHAPGSLSAKFEVLSLVPFLANALKRIGQAPIQPVKS